MTAHRDGCGEHWGRRRKASRDGTRERLDEVRAARYGDLCGDRGLSGVGLHGCFEQNVFAAALCGVTCAGTAHGKRSIWGHFRPGGTVQRDFDNAPLRPASNQLEEGFATVWRRSMCLVMMCRS